MIRLLIAPLCLALAVMNYGGGGHGLCVAVPEPWWMAAAKSMWLMWLVMALCHIGPWIDLWRGGRDT